VSVSHPSSEPSTFTVLLVCTGNICRSALAERLGRAFLDDVLGELAGDVQVVSAGTQAVVDSAMHPDSALVLRGYGGDPGDFRARQLVDRMVADADLTLAMTRAHRREVLHRAPRAMARTFTVREAADLIERLGNGPVDGTTFPERARNLVASMAEARSSRRAGEDDDVPDPIGRPLEAHDEAGTLIVDSLLPVLRRIADLRLV
jgi:protein-tyrosine phosphatase